MREETFFFSDLNRLISGSAAVRVLRCEVCHKAEFYILDEENRRNNSRTAGSSRRPSISLKLM
ncbi:hypothetical protein AALB64_12180 [Lachnospiraceae bacterium 45-P1]